MKKNRHVIEFLAPLALFFAFALSALIVIVFAARVYKNTVEDSARNHTAGTAIAYITEKIHSGDTEGAVSAGRFDGCDALLLRSTFSDDTYVTAVYLKDGQLMELFMKEGADTSADAGTPVLPLSAFRVEETDAGLFRVECTDEDQHTKTAYISVRSR